MEAGWPLDCGPPSPHDILRIFGPQAVGQYLLKEVQSICRIQRFPIDDKHIEIIVAQMLRKVRVHTSGSTPLVPGTLVDRFSFQMANDRLSECVEINDPGDSEFEDRQIVGKKVFDEELARLEHKSMTPPTGVPPTAATGVPELLGISRLGKTPESLVAAASVQETAKVLAGAALTGKVDYLAGLKENVILGRLVPAGTGFPANR